MPLPTLAEMDRFASSYDTADSFGALPADVLADDDALSGVDSDDLLAGASDFVAGDELGWGWRSIRRGLRKTYKTARSVTRSKAFRLGAAGVAIAFPAAAPAVIALEAANKIATAAEQGSQEARATIRATVAAARKGDPGAARAAAQLKLAFKARKVAKAKVRAAVVAAPRAQYRQPPGPVRGVLTAADGTRLPGVWVRA